MSVFSQRLKELLEEKNLQQKDFCEAMNFSKNQVHYWIKGKASPSLEHLAEIARFFKVSADYLLGLTDDTTPNWE